MVAELSNAISSEAGNSFLDGIVIDVIVEPARKKMIPGFDKVKEECNESCKCNLACTISGAGPSVIAFVCDDNEKDLLESWRSNEERFQICKGRL